MLLILVLAPISVKTTNESPFEHGYSDGISDGKSSARDSIDACSEYSGIYSGKYNDSTPAATQCYNGYNLGFKKGCAGMMWYRDEHQEYPTCYQFYNFGEKRLPDEDWKCNHPYDGAFDPDCKRWPNDASH